MVTVTLSGDGKAVTTELEPGLCHVAVRCAKGATLSWELPAADIHNCWHPMALYERGLPVEWSPGFTATATTGAPVVCLSSQGGQNRLTFALSDALHGCAIKVGVHEETATLRCSVQLATAEAILRLDLRALPYHRSLADVAHWWASLPGYEPAPVPEGARRPVYSTWYSFHQQVDAGALEAECRVARELGCEAVIVDDGWQTVDNQRGYAYCGDWEVAPAKIPDMKALADRIHGLGMQFLLWYSVPFVGVHSRAYQRFRDRLLCPGAGPGSYVLDPRFPEVRAYITDLYEKALQEWDLDGFKLDFVDRFVQPAEDEAGDGPDFDSVPAAVDRLLTDVMARLRRIKPDVLIEFRQRYVGPLMRKYGNIFRAADCPNDALTNRIRTLDIRLLCGSTAAHADMVMWHKGEPVASAAMQLVHTLFAVPQVSVRLDRLPPDHLAMLRFWLSFWREHRDVLLDGDLAPLAPAELYPVVVAATPAKRLIAVYADHVVPVGCSLPPVLLLVNGTAERRLVLDVAENAGPAELEVHDCCGRLTERRRVHLSQGLHAIGVPSGGAARLRR